MSFTLICTHHLPYGQTWGRNKKDTDETSQDMAIQWPSGGGFWITVEADDRPPVSIPLSPPYWVRVPTTPAYGKLILFLKKKTYFCTLAVIGRRLRVMSH